MAASGASHAVVLLTWSLDLTFAVFTRALSRHALVKAAWATLPVWAPMLFAYERTRPATSRTLEEPQ